MSERELKIKVKVAMGLELVHWKKVSICCT